MKLFIFKIMILLNIGSLLSAKIKIINYRTQLKSICGKPNKNGRIVGGSNATLGEFPWIGRILVNDTKPPSLLCGATLITDLHMLTAKHCFFDFNESKLLPLTFVSLGDYNVSGRKAWDEKQYAHDPLISKIIKIIKYNFDEKKPTDDIAVLKLAEKVQFTSRISPICLPYNTSPTKLVGENVVVIGFGFVNSFRRKLPNVLQKATITIKSLKDCKMYGNPPGPGQICAGNPTKDSCGGDSGGPLIKLLKEKDGPRYILLGIVSFGSRICEDSNPAIYTDVNYYLDWIDKQLVI